MPRVTLLKRVNLRKAWPNEARDFTPWLAENIALLGAELDLSLERAQTEVTLPRAGRVDIRAHQAETDTSVVIENQLGTSDDSHCLRLLGYAAAAEANILVWVAAGFTRYHKRILKWLNDADTIDVYAVRVRAYRVGDRLTFDFRTVVRPPQPDPLPRRPTLGTLYARFYRPLVARLSRNGVHAVRRGGGRGRYRSFESGRSGATYWTGFDDGRPRVGLYLHGPGHQDRYDGLVSRQAEIAEKVDGAVSRRDRQHGIVLVRPEVLPVAEASEEEMDAARRWMEDNLLSLRSAAQPHLDELLRARDTHSGAAKGAD